MTQIRYVIGTLILIVMVALNLSFTSNAYTEEEKQQAKAWLSAHGYSPDAGGASQAYQDYLNGKFDEELGVDVNGDGIPASTEESSTEEITEEEVGGRGNTETDGEADKNATETDGEADKSTTETGGEAEKNATENAVKTLGEIATETSAEEEESSAQEEVEAISVDGIEDVADDSVNGESTLYPSEKEDEYQVAAIVIMLVVVLVMLAGLWLKK